jgi:hypothetical protein
MRYFMTRSVNAVRPAPGEAPDRVWVNVTLDCGCRIERTVTSNRLIEVEDIDGHKNYFIAGGFLCDSHSPEPQ